MQCLREEWPKYPFTEGCRFPGTTGPLEIHTCLPPAMFREQHCTRAVPQLKLWEFSQMLSTLFIRSHVNWLWQTQTKGHSATVSIFSVPQVPKILILIWPQEISQWSQHQPGGQLPEWKFLHLHKFFCIASTSVREHKKSPKQRLFPAGTDIKPWKKCRMWNYWYKSEYPLLWELAAFQDSLTAKPKSAPHHLEN